MLPPADAAELRILAGAGHDSLHDAIEEIRPEPGRECEQQQELRLAIQLLLPHEAAVGRIVIRRWRIEREPWRNGIGVLLKMPANPMLEGRFELLERALQIGFDPRRGSGDRAHGLDRHLDKPSNFLYPISD
jgi:hypothetical protein